MQNHELKRLFFFKAAWFWSGLANNGSRQRTESLGRKIAGVLKLGKTGFSLLVLRVSLMQPRALLLNLWVPAPLEVKWPFHGVT